MSTSARRELAALMSGVLALTDMECHEKEWGLEYWATNHAQEGKSYCTKVMILKQGFQCSLHWHELKHETFIVTRGRMYLELATARRVVSPYEAIIIPPRFKHRFTGLEETVFVESSSFHREDDTYRDEPSRQVDLATPEWQKLIAAA